MVCLVLAAGYATRLYPLTENFPKPLLDVNGRTILDWLLYDIRDNGGIEKFVVISNHKFAHHFEKWASDSSLDITVADDNTQTNETRLGAVKDIQFAIDSLKIDDDVMVIAGDNVLDFSLGSFIKYQKDKKASCVMRYYEENDEKLKKCGVATLGENDLLVEMNEKPETPKSHWCTPPFYIYTKEDAKKIPEALEDGCGFDAPGSFVSWLCKKSAVYSMEMPGSRYDIGNIESYEKVKETYKGIVK